MASIPLPADVRPTPVAVLHYLLQFTCRYYVATVLLFYAAGKVLQTQFYSSPSMLDTPVRELSGMALTWAFYGRSYEYGLVLAAAQVFCSLLLFWRRTVRLGVLLFLPIMGNIVLLDYFYDIPALPTASVLLGMGLYLFLADAPAFLRYALGTPYVRSEAALGVGALARWERRARWAKAVYVPAALAGAFLLLHALRVQHANLGPLVGIWSLPTPGWDRLYIDSAYEAYVRPQGGGGGPLQYSRCVIDPAARTLRIVPAHRYREGRRSVAAGGFEFEGRYELSPDGESLTLRPVTGAALVLQGVPAGRPLRYIVP